MLAAALFSLIAAGDGRCVELFAGGYSFSDELGGFRLVAVSGSGSGSDPVVVVEEIEEAAPVTLVIRRHRGLGGEPRSGSLHLTMVKVVINRSSRVWAGFEVELQEVLKKPSVYGDGLSFNQFGASAADVASDAFADNYRLFEPYDRIRFENGHIDPDATGRFQLLITDPTPVAEFYLVQDPKLLSAMAPNAEADVAFVSAKPTRAAARWRPAAVPFRH